MALLVDWESMEMCMRSRCPDCSVCSGVVVEGRVNGEGGVVVVNGR